MTADVAATSSSSEGSSRWLGLTDFVVYAVTKTTCIVERSQRSLVEKPLKVMGSIPSLEEPARVLEAAWQIYAASVFGTIRGVNWAAGGLVGGGISLLSRLDPAPQPAAATPMRSDVMWSLPWCRDMALGALNGVVGDSLRETGNPLQITMSFRNEGVLQPLQPDALLATFPEPTGKVCVFVHGSCNTEWSWSLGAEERQGDARATYGSLLSRDLGFTPFYLRYNSGLHISENGEQLSELLDSLVAAYPRPVEELVLIGHSMGGLVARSACQQAAATERSWLAHVSRVICLASPHQGAPLEKFGNVATSILGRFDIPSTQIPAELINERSAGIKDLRFGYLLHDDWRGQDPDATLENNRHPTPLLDGIDYHFLASSFTEDPEHPAGRLLGDLVVRVPSASGGLPELANRVAVEQNMDRVLGGLGHLEVVNHPRVYEQIKAWCSPRVTSQCP